VRTAHPTQDINLYTDTKTITGGRDDLVLDGSRCLKMRYSESCCRRCADICPHRAISLDGFLAVNPHHCRGCLLCTSLCPTGALEENADFSSILAQLSRVPAPVFGCVRTKEASNSSLPCLGGLSEEHLLTLCHSLTGTLTINLTGCAECPNCAIISHLRQRLESLYGGELLEGGCNIRIAESTEDIDYQAEAVDRRGFFGSFRKSLFQSAAVILSANNKQSERRTGYAEKRLPIRRKLLNDTRKKLSIEQAALLGKRLDTSLSISEACSKCQGCVAICPTGALQNGASEAEPTFDPLICTGCGVCREFCMDAAIRILTEKSED